MRKLVRINRAGLIVLVLAGSMAMLSTAYAAGFMKIAGVEGESIDKDHKGEIEIQSWSWGVSQPASTSAMSTGKRQHKPIYIARLVDKSSPILQQASTDGRAFPSMTVYLPKQEGDGTGYLTYELKNVIITSYQVSGEGAGAPPTESFSLNYEKIMQTGKKSVEDRAATATDRS